MRHVSLLLFTVLFSCATSFAQPDKLPIHRAENRNKNKLPTKLRIKLFLHGYFNKESEMTPVLRNEGKSNQLNIVDTLQVLIRTNYYPYKIISSRRVLLSTTGYLECAIKRLKGNYFISIRSRSGLETWTSHTINMNRRFVLYDFTTSSNKAFGHNMIEVDKGVWAFYSCDINKDRFVDYDDIAILEKAIDNYSFGFISSDTNGDGNVDLLDRSIIEKEIDVTNDGRIDAKDFEILKKHPNLRIHVKRPSK